MSNVKKKTADQATFKSGMTSYFRGVRAEWGKITWPERRQVIMETIVVIGVVFFFTALVYLMDIIFKGLLGFIPSR